MKEKLKVMSVRMDSKLAKWARKEAHRREQTFSAMVRGLLAAERKLLAKGRIAKASKVTA